MIIDQLLMQTGSNKAYFIELFGITERTYQRWNKQPPAHVHRLFSQAMRHPDRPEQWQHWHFDRDFLLDPDGNHYRQNEIKAIFWNRQLIDELTGRPSHVLSMKQHLDKKIKATQSPRIEISLFSGNQAIKQWTQSL